jgi:CRP/FNR family transcriptional regulator, cyclic AMP receptor protein
MILNDSSPSQRFLKAQPWYATLDERHRIRVDEASQVYKGPKGEVLLHASIPVEGWYAVLSGLVKLESLSNDGRRSTFLGVPAGEWFGEGSALKTEPRRYEVIALRDTEMLCLPKAVFDELRAGNLAFNQFLVGHLNMRLGQAMAMIESSRTRSPE